MTPLACQLLVLAKEPLAGRVKTRLTPPLTPEQGAAVAAAALADTLAAVAATPVARRVLVLDGATSFPVPPGFDVLPQAAGGLDARLTAAFADAAATCDLPLLLVGMDTPQVTPDLLTRAVHALLASSSVLGLAADGGWWACGLHAPHPRAFDGVPMSTDRTGSAQAARLTELGLPPAALPVLRDIDTAADLSEVLAQVRPDSALARLAPTLLDGARA
ncbi:MAG: glycosyltransferase [Frankiales bacterium]|nr:glycosyltransferase [Frankiales bacterium]